ncbi:MAG TPA: hypothetical protein VIH71_04690 [Solirubrobacteraceae bacterium]
MGARLHGVNATAAWLALFFSLVLVATPAQASEPMPIGVSAPLPGAVVPLEVLPDGASYLSPLFEFRFAIGVALKGGDRFLQRLSVCVSTEDTIAEARLAGTCVARGEPSLVGSEAVWPPDNPSLATPGTYYWQPIGVTDEITAGGEQRWYEYVGPVSSFTVALPAPTAPAPIAPAPPKPAPPSTAPSTIPPLTLEEAYRVVKKTITDETHRVPYHVSDKCRLTGEWEASCRTSWSSARRPTARTLIYAGVFALSADAAKVHFGFTGLRESVGCYHHHGTKACARSVHWSR